MPYLQLQYPLSPELMDIVLAQGYYRMQQSVFTTNAIRVEEGRIFEVFWARIKLNDFIPGKGHQELTRRCRRFSCTLVEDMIIDKEIEDLYAVYARSVNFDGPESVSSFLLGESTVNYFPGKTWQVHDGERLIAVGYFDEGHQSAAGILNFYDPAYKKFSLGKWLYLESVRYAAERGKQFFYPGYIVPDYPKFDYKLLPGKERIELWDAAMAQWKPYGE